MKEAAFNIQGERRLEKVVWRHRLDEGQNITLSYNPASMTCSGCKVRGVHSVCWGRGWEAGGSGGK